MSYTLTPIIVKISDVQAAIGSNDTQLLQAVIAANTDEMIDIDALGEFFEDFESEFEAEYAAYSQGDFSYRHTIRAMPDSADDEEDDPELDGIKAAFLSGDKGDITSSLKSFFGQMFEDDGDDDDELDDEPVRELSTGGALADLILGRERDPAYGFKYGYALEMLCGHLGERPLHNSWCSIRSAAFDAIDEKLFSLGVPAGQFSTHQAFLSRGAPVSLPEPDDFPFMGDLTNAEIAELRAKLDTDQIQRLPVGEDDGSDEWAKAALSELSEWMRLAMNNQSDLLTFYA